MTDQLHESLMRLAPVVDLDASGRAFNARRNHVRRRRRMVATIAAAVAVVGVGSGVWAIARPELQVIRTNTSAAPGPTPSTAPKGASHAPNELTGTWRLVSGAGFDPAYSEVLSIDSASTMSGRFGCNTCTVPFSLEVSQIVFGTLESTANPCPPLPGDRNAFIAAVEKLTTVARAGDRLVLTGTSVELIYERFGASPVPLPPVPPAPLDGTRWQLMLVVDNGQQNAASVAWLRFDRDALTGSTGCRDFNGSLAGPAEQRTMATFAPDGDCTGDDFAHRRDDAVVPFLKGGFSYKIDARTLTLTGLNGRQLVLGAT
jgi:heat shock protein HslJ